MSLPRVFAALLVAVVGSIVGWTIADLLATGRQGLFGPVVAEGDSAHGFVLWLYRAAFCGMALIISWSILAGG